ncbi:hypothetical protein EW145_g7158 [Phellinidium pouzarii]|uniref:Polysaccharide lyase 14 domain-containing protein n=1 Tax=Phellinidium pouzarii TaxID=167371 RepID=A0A4S4KP80_9AGAM|nr:hypothetical protein EW145_g7158 [Phellinidium pouzarii]
MLAFPSSTMAASDATSFIQSKWSLQGGISFGKNSLSFVPDPTSKSSSSSDSNSSNGAVFAVTYDAGTYSHGTGGAQFYATFGGSAGFEAMLLSYDIMFDEDFDWVKGGKLPGLRGGPKTNSCSGGNEPTGSDCFSSRLMWRADGAGEGVSVNALWLAASHAHV